MIKVLNPGVYTTIQDLGRFGYEHFGVPVSGAMDLFSATLANKLLGNREEDAVMEITLSGPQLQFAGQTTICITGANLSPRLNTNPIPMHVPIRVLVGDILSFGTLQQGCRAYLSVIGGFKTESVMESRSMFKGLTKQFRIAKGDVLDIKEQPTTVALNSKLRAQTLNLYDNGIEVLRGPEFEKLSETEHQQLLSREFTISKDNSRMGYRLEESLENTLEPIITSLVMPGTVQLTPSGVLIVLMRDCQTTGGYPRVLQLKESSINRLAQFYTGQKIKFKLVEQ